ncbi:MAG: Ig-like domain-containing protein, partial [Bacteroidota bacterium]
GFANSLLAGNILTNDLNPNQNTLTVNTLPVVAPSHGTLSLNPNGTFIFQPDQNFTGTDVLQYLVCDDGTPAICEMATVTLTILPPFSAVDDPFSTFQNTPVYGQVLPNDPNSYGNLPLVTLVAGASPQHGSVTILPDGSFVFTPSPGFTGADSFQYSACEANPAWCDTATVFITVQPAPDAVVAVDDVFQTTENQPVSGNVLANDANPNGSPLTVSLLPGGNSLHGNLSLNPNGNFTYTPLPGFTGTDVFAYVVCENAGAPCDTAQVSIVVSDLPQVTAEDDFFLTSPSSPVFADVTSNDQIPGGSTFQVSEINGGDPAHGQFILGSNGTFIYQPDPGFAGTDAFQYEL